ncbi:MAG: MoaD/ThiS family protein, partial [Chloroflexota bacterium]
GHAFDCAVPDNATIGQLVLETLLLPSEEVAIALVNGMVSDRERLLKDGDQVALWPPIAGGAG